MMRYLLPFWPAWQSTPTSVLLFTLLATAQSTTSPTSSTAFKSTSSLASTTPSASTTSANDTGSHTPPNNISTSSSSTNGAVFVYTSTDNHARLTFAINIDVATHDAYFHLSGPAGNSWLAIGFGRQMAQARMLIAYSSANGTGTTLSPRLATGHAEPVYDPSVNCELSSNRAGSSSGHTPNEPVSSSNETSRPIGYMAVDGVCRNVSLWLGDGVKLGAQAQEMQPMIFAVGPGWTLTSDDKSVGLRRHDYYGRFEIDLHAATSQNASVPVPNGVNGTYTTLHASTSVTDLHEDGSAVPILHGLGMCATFALVFPFGSLILRVFNKVMLHIVIQVFGFFLVILAMAGGVHVSKQYNRSKDFRSAHQILGSIIVVALSAQLGLGILNHRIVKRRQQNGNNRRALLAKIHIYLGPTAIILGIINGGLGFNFAQNGFLGARYAIVLVAIALLYVAIRLTIHFCGKRRREMKQDEMEMSGRPEGYQYPQFGPPPAYPAAYANSAGQGFVPQMPPPQYVATQQHQQQQQLHQRPMYERETSNVSQTGLPVQARTLV